MARVEEIMASRIGTQIGLNGSYNATRTFRVFLDNAGDNPIAVMADSATTNGVGLGEFHPWAEVQLIVLFYALRDILWPKCYIVDAVYGSPSMVEAIQPGWSFRMAAGLDTEHVYADLDGKPIGPIKWTEFVPPSGQVFFSAASDRDASRVQLRLSGGGSNWEVEKVRFRDGVSRYVRGGTVEFSRIIPIFDASTIGLVNNNVGTVNNDNTEVSTLASPIPVPFGAPGELMLVGASADPVNNTGSSQYSFPYYRIGIEMKWRYGGWQHRIRHTHRLDAGNESEVLDASGSPVDEDFRIYASMNFHALMQSFGR